MEQDLLYTAGITIEIIGWLFITYGFFNWIAERKLEKLKKKNNKPSKGVNLDIKA